MGATGNIHCSVYHPLTLIAPDTVGGNSNFSHFICRNREIDLDRFLIQIGNFFSQGKPLKQTIMEAFFGPVKLQKLHHKEIQSFFEDRGFRIFDIKGIKDVGFYSSHTCFVMKVIR